MVVAYLTYYIYIFLRSAARITCTVTEVTPMASAVGQSYVAQYSLPYQTITCCHSVFQNARLSYVLSHIMSLDPAKKTYVALTARAGPAQGPPPSGPLERRSAAKTAT